MGTLKDGLKHHLSEGVREFLVGLAANKVSGMTASDSSEPPKIKDEIFTKLQHKRRILQKYVADSPAERKKKVDFVRSATSDSPKDFVGGDRFLDFGAACLKDRRQTGKSEQEIAEFFVWLSKQDEDDLFTMIVLCTEVADGVTWVLPGVTLHINKMKKINRT